MGDDLGERRPYALPDLPVGRQDFHVSSAFLRSLATALIKSRSPEPVNPAPWNHREMPIPLWYRPFCGWEYNFRFSR
jgi:hypothetical protein